ncbi:hypothetical protein Pelo_5249 [Pelomyxa schiedti]|nr:hypothetical protein Pelo_5249 [Pelomyxa schiedti]
MDDQNAVDNQTVSVLTTSSVVRSSAAAAPSSQLLDESHDEGVDTPMNDTRTTSTDLDPIPTSTAPSPEAVESPSAPSPVPSPRMAATLARQQQQRGVRSCVAVGLAVLIGLWECLMWCIGVWLSVTYDMLGNVPHVLLSSMLGFPVLGLTAKWLYMRAWKKRLQQSGGQPASPTAAAVPDIGNFRFDSASKWYCVACVVLGALVMVVSSVLLGMQTAPWVSTLVWGVHRVGVDSSTGRVSPPSPVPHRLVYEFGPNKATVDLDNMTYSNDVYEHWCAAPLVMSGLQLPNFYAVCRIAGRGTDCDACLTEWRVPLCSGVRVFMTTADEAMRLCYKTTVGKNSVIEPEGGLVALAVQKGCGGGTFVSRSQWWVIAVLTLNMFGYVAPMLGLDVYLRHLEQVKID